MYKNGEKWNFVYKNGELVNYIYKNGEKIYDMLPISLFKSLNGEFLGSHYYTTESSQYQSPNIQVPARVEAKTRIIVLIEIYSFTDGDTDTMDCTVRVGNNSSSSTYTYNNEGEDIENNPAIDPVRYPYGFVSWPRGDYGLEVPEDTTNRYTYNVYYISIPPESTFFSYTNIFFETPTNGKGVYGVYEVYSNSYTIDKFLEYKLGVYFLGLDEWHTTDDSIGFIGTEPTWNFAANILTDDYNSRPGNSSITPNSYIKDAWVDVSSHPFGVLFSHLYTETGQNVNQQSTPPCNLFVEAFIDWTNEI